MTCSSGRNRGNWRAAQTDPLAAEDSWTADVPVIYYAHGGVCGIRYLGQSFVVSPEVPLRLPAGTHTFVSFPVVQVATQAYCWAEEDLSAKED